MPSVTGWRSPVLALPLCWQAGCAARTPCSHAPDPSSRTRLPMPSMRLSMNPDYMRAPLTPPSHQAGGEGKGKGVTVQCRKTYSGRLSQEPTSYAIQGIHFKSGSCGPLVGMARFLPFQAVRLNPSGNEANHRPRDHADQTCNEPAEIGSARSNDPGRPT